MFDPSMQPKASPKFKKSKPPEEPVKKRDSQPVESSSPVKKSSISDEELQNQLKAVKEKHKEMEIQLEAFLTKSGLSKEAIKTFLDNPNNFSSSGWKILQSKRENLTKKIWDYVGGEKSQEAASIKSKQKLKNATIQKECVFQRFQEIY